MAKNKTEKMVKKIKSERTVKLYKSMGAKVLVATVLSIMMSLNICIAIAQSFAENRITQAQIDGISSVAEEKAVALERFITDQKAIVKLIKTNSTIVENAKIYDLIGDMTAAKQRSVGEYLATINANNNFIYENLFVTFGPMGFADCLGNTSLRDYSEDAFYKAVMEKGYYIESEVSADTGHPVFVISYPINSKQDNSIIGTVCMVIDMVSLSNEIVKSDTYDITVIDKKGYIVASNKDGSLLTNIKDMDPENFANMLETGSGNMLIDLSQYGGSASYISYYVTNNFIMETSIEETAISEPINEMKRNLTYVSFAMGIIAIVIITVVIEIIIRPLKKATKGVEQVAADILKGEADLTKKIEVKSQDEIGVLVNGVNNLVETMSGIISNVQTTTSKVTDSSAEINKKIENAELEISNVSATMEEMSASSEETSASMTQVMTEVDSVVELVIGVNDESTKNVQYAESVTNKVKKIREKSERDREEATNHLNEVAVNLRDKINNAKQVQEIANLTTEILSITSKTNLLSLNASIEAARAGEAGRGFAVVADEIRQLADSSKEAANRIQEVTSNVILAVEDLASEAENVTDFMLQNNEDNLKESTELTENYSSDIMKLSEAMESFKASSDDIKAAMDVIKEAIDAVNIAADETAQGIANVAQSTVELTNELQSVVGMANENLNESNELANTMNKFTV